MAQELYYEKFERIEEEGKKTLSEWLDNIVLENGEPYIETKKINVLHIQGTNFYLRPEHQTS